MAVLLSLLLVSLACFSLATQYLQTTQGLPTDSFRMAYGLSCCRFLQTSPRLPPDHPQDNRVTTSGQIASKDDQVRVSVG